MGGGYDDEFQMGMESGAEDDDDGGDDVAAGPEKYGVLGDIMLTKAMPYR